MRLVITALLLATCAASPARAAPFLIVGGTPTTVAMVDQGATKRGGGSATADVLMVPGAGDPKMVTMKFDCTGRTSQQISVRTLWADLSLSASRPLTVAPQPVGTGTLSAGLLDRACFDRQSAPGAPLTLPTLREAVAQGRLLLARQAAAGT